jgi:hypothetical protein
MRIGTISQSPFGRDLRVALQEFDLRSQHISEPCPAFVGVVVAAPLVDFAMPIPAQTTIVPSAAPKGCRNM